MSPHLVLVCGPAGAGKTTHARRLAAQGYELVSFDEMLWAAGRTGPHPLPDVLTRPVEDEVRARVRRLLEAGRSVVVEKAFAVRVVRDEYRALGAEHGARVEVLYVDTPREVALARVAARRGTGPDDVVLLPGVAETYHDGFEVPTADEGPLRTVRGV